MRDQRIDTTRLQSMVYRVANPWRRKFQELVHRSYQHLPSRLDCLFFGSALHGYSEALPEDDIFQFPEINPQRLEHSVRTRKSDKGGVIGHHLSEPCRDRFQQLTHIEVGDDSIVDFQ